ncbi:E3 ubiquitin-protein ligase RNF115-like [Glandiceps talaboti]
MAEASLHENSNSRPRFFCHSCTREISPKLPEYTCPRCDTGFIEELNNDVTEDSGNNVDHIDQDPAAQFAELWSRAFFETFAPPNTTTPTTTTTQDDGSSSSSSSSSSSDNQDNRETERAERERRRPPFGTRISFRRTNSRNERARAIDMILQQLLGGLGGAAVLHAGQGQGFPIQMLNLHGNPADYAWGSGGLDAIITQLLNNLEGTGPPPADKEKVEALPKVRITKEHTDQNLECSVCKEDFSLDEPVRKLPCSHLFHNDCIIPWLELHNTCPVCRKGIDDEDNNKSSSDSGSDGNDRDNRGPGSSSSRPNRSGGSVYDFHDD